MTDKNIMIIHKAMLIETSLHNVIRCVLLNRDALGEAMQDASNAFQELQEEVIYGESVDDYAD